MSLHRNNPRSRRRMTPEERQQMQQESLLRARTCKDHGPNIAIIMDECARRGYTNVRPGENVLTFNAWKALGRKVKKGEKGIKIPVYFSRSTADQADEDSSRTIRTNAHVFHESQTEPATPGTTPPPIPPKPTPAADLFEGLFQ